MSDTEVPSVVAAERLRAGVVIKFSDGLCGFYSNVFLYTKLPEAQPLNESGATW